MMKLRFYLALWIARCAYLGMKLLKRNASYLPGAIALKICPDYLRYIARPKQVILVSGTDGKTTTCNLIATLFEKDGKKVASNRLGSNTQTGISTAMTVSTTFFNRTKADAAVLETDEHYVRIIAPKLKPDYLIVTCLLRDSLQRNAHPEYVFSKINATVCPGMKVILNADELCSARLLPGNERIYFGIDRRADDLLSPPNRVNDFPLCPECSHALVYDYVRYGDVGHAHCPHCGFESPHADCRITAVHAESDTLELDFRGTAYTLPLTNDSLFNIYNEAAALTLFLDLGTAPAEMQKIFSEAKLTKTRFSDTVVNGTRIVKMMAKSNNSLPVSLVFDYLRKKPGRKAILLAMDDLDEKTSSERIGWIWDTDYEFLKDNGIVQILVSGKRCADHLLRLLMAGIPREKLVCDTDESKVIAALDTSVDAVYILHDMSSYSGSVRAEEQITKLLEAKA